MKKNMNVNVWNIKEMLSMPIAPGFTRFSTRGSGPTEHSSPSNSQPLFGSQLCPENLQAAPLKLSTQLGQHNSQDSQPSIFTKYQTKPPLFDEDPKEKGLLHFGAGRERSFLENFEVCKNKIKDKHDREVLSTFMSSIKDQLQGLQACLDKFGEMFESRNKSILVHLETISKTLQDALQSQCGSVLEALTDKSQMEQALLEMERRLAAKNEEMSDMKTSFQLLKEGLEALPAQLSGQYLKLWEEQGFLKLPNTLAELHTLVSRARLPPHMVDNSSQTSSGLCQDDVLGEKNAQWPCCHGRGVCSSSGGSQHPCMAVREQHGDCPVSCQVTRNGTPQGDLNIPSGGKASPKAPVVGCRENTCLQKVKYGLETQSCANHPHVCCAKCHFWGESQKEQCPQEEPLQTPLEKVRRGVRGFEPMSLSLQPQVCHLSVRKEGPVRSDHDWVTDREVENVAVGRKAKQRPGRIPWDRAVGRKKMCPTMRKGEVSRRAGSGLKQRKANGITELESSRKNGFPRYMIALNLGSSSPVPAACNQQILSSAQPRLMKNFPPVPCSNKSLQQLVDKRKRSLKIKRRANVSNIKGKLWDSSPQENIFSLCSTTGESQMSCFTLQSPASSQKPRPVSPLAQQKVAYCSLVFDSDYSD